MSNPLFLSLVAAFGFGVWPVVARFSKMTTSYVAILVSLATFLGVMIGMIGSAAKSPWSTKGMVFCLAAGFFNSLGIIAYSRLLSNPTWDLTK